MCGRYSLDLEKSKSNFKEETHKKFTKIFSYRDNNISPSSNNPIIYLNNNEFIFDLFKWGLNFDWLPKGRVLFNVRSETIFEKKFSKDLLLKQRCLVPFNSYFEWQNRGSLKQKFELKTDKHISYFAAIYSNNGNIKEYSILTKSSLSDIEHIHNRAPVIVPNKSIKKWFSDGFKEVLSDSVVLKFSEV